MIMSHALTIFAGNNVTIVIFFFFLFASLLFALFGYAQRMMKTNWNSSYGKPFTRYISILWAKKLKN